MVEAGDRQLMPAALQRVALAVTALVLLAAPWPLGSIAAPAQAAICLSAVIVLVAWVASAQLQRTVDRRSALLWAGLACAAGIGLLQVAPLPMGILRMLSPEAGDAYASAGAAWGTISVDPDATWAMLARVGALAVICLVAAHCIRSTRHVRVLFTVVLLAALSQAVYGTVRWASSSDAIFGFVPSIVSPGASGSFLNAAHFAGLVGAAIPLVVAFAASARNRRARAGLALVAMLLVTALVLSQSRSGWVSLGVAAIVFGLCALAAYGARTRTLCWCAAVTVVLLAGQFIAGEIVLRQITGDRAPVLDWADRLDLYRSAGAMLAAYPLVGCGLGGFESAFPRFQSARFGDRVAEHLQSDWLELACSVGWVGFACILLAGGVFFVRIVRALRSSQPGSARWATIGGVAALAFLGVQAAFASTLAEVPALGLVAAVVAAATLRASRFCSRTVEPCTSSIRWTPARRFAVGAAAIGIACVGVVMPLRRAAAEIAYHRGLAAVSESGDRHFLWALDAAPESEAHWLGEARRLNPGCAEYARRHAARRGAEADRLLLDEATVAARQHIGEHADPAVLHALVRTLLPQLTVDASPPVARALSDAARAYDAAIALRPTCPEQRLDRVALDVRRGRARIADAIGTAVAFAPNRPSVRYRASMLLLMGATAQHDSTARQTGFRRASTALHAALLADPNLTTRAYDALLSATDRVDLLFAATPQTVDASRRLVEYLGARGAWREAARAATRFQAIGTAEARLASARARCLVYGRLQRWRARREAERELAVIEGPILATRVRRARARIDARDVREATQDVESVLAVDPLHVGATLAFAEAIASDASARDPGVNDRVVVALGALIGATGGETSQWRRVKSMLRAHPVAEPNARLARLLDAWSAIRVGATRQAIAMLRPIARRASDGPLSHLPDAWLARLLSERGDEDRARLHWRAVLDRSPTHAAAAKALDRTSPTAGMTSPVGIVFGGRAELLGYTLAPSADGVRLSLWWRPMTVGIGGLRVVVRSSRGRVTQPIGPATGWPIGAIRRVGHRVGCRRRVSNRRRRHRFARHAPRLDHPRW